MAGYRRAPAGGTCGESPTGGPRAAWPRVAVKGGGSMKQTVPLGRVADIQIGAHWSVLVMVIMIGWLLGGQVLPDTAPGQLTAAYWAVAVPRAGRVLPWPRWAGWPTTWPPSS